MAFREHVRSSDDPRPAFHVVVLPDDPRIADPSLRQRGETFTQTVRPRPAEFRALHGVPLPPEGTPFSWETE